MPEETYAELLTLAQAGNFLEFFALSPESGIPTPLKPLTVACVYGFSVAKLSGCRLGSEASRDCCVDPVTRREDEGTPSATVSGPCTDRAASCWR
jgi:hypothetical protein